MTTFPDLEPAGLEAAYAEYKEVIGDIDAGDRLVIRRSIAAYLAASSAPEAGKAPNEADIYDQAATLAVPAKDGGTYFDGIEAYRLQLTLKAALLRLDGTSISGASE